MESYIGKIITIKINDRDIEGNIIINKFTTVKGLCSYHGYNKIFNCYQITINRMPILPFKESDIIKIEENEN
jgi:hypothetical protein